MTVQSLKGKISMLFLCCGVAAPQPMEQVCSPDAHSLSIIISYVQHMLRLDTPTYSISG